MVRASLQLKSDTAWLARDSGAYWGGEPASVTLL